MRLSSLASTLQSEISRVGSSSSSGRRALPHSAGIAYHVVVITTLLLRVCVNYYASYDHSFAEVHPGLTPMRSSLLFPTVTQSATTGMSFASSAQRGDFGYRNDWRRRGTISTSSSLSFFSVHAGETNTVYCSVVVAAVNSRTSTDSNSVDVYCGEDAPDTVCVIELTACNVFDNLAQPWTAPFPTLKFMFTSVVAGGGTRTSVVISADSVLPHLEFAMHFRPSSTILIENSRTMGIVLSKAVNQSDIVLKNVTIAYNRSEEFSGPSPRRWLLGAEYDSVWGPLLWFHATDDVVETTVVLQGISFFLNATAPSSWLNGMFGGAFVASTLSIDSSRLDVLGGVVSVQYFLFRVASRSSVSVMTSTFRMVTAMSQHFYWQPPGFINPSWRKWGTETSSSPLRVSFRNSYFSLRSSEDIHFMSGYPFKACTVVMHGCSLDIHSPSRAMVFYQGTGNQRPIPSTIYRVAVFVRNSVIAVTARWSQATVFVVDEAVAPYNAYEDASAARLLPFQSNSYPLGTRASVCQRRIYPSLDDSNLTALAAFDDRMTFAAFYQPTSPNYVAPPLPTNGKETPPAFGYVLHIERSQMIVALVEWDDSSSLGLRLATVDAFQGAVSVPQQFRDVCVSIAQSSVRVLTSRGRPPPLAILTVDAGRRMAVQLPSPSLYVPDHPMLPMSPTCPLLGASYSVLSSDIYVLAVTSSELVTVNARVAAALPPYKASQDDQLFQLWLSQSQSMQIRPPSAATAALLSAMLSADLVDGLYFRFNASTIVQSIDAAEGSPPLPLMSRPSVGSASVLLFPCMHNVDIFVQGSELVVVNILSTSSVIGVDGSREASYVQNTNVHLAGASSIVHLLANMRGDVSQLSFSVANASIRNVDVVISECSLLWAGHAQSAASLVADFVTWRNVSSVSFITFEARELANVSALVMSSSVVARVTRHTVDSVLWKVGSVNGILTDDSAPYYTVCQACRGVVAGSTIDLSTFNGMRTLSIASRASSNGVFPLVTVWASSLVATGSRIHLAAPYAKVIATGRLDAALTAQLQGNATLQARLRSFLRRPAYPHQIASLPNVWRAFDVTVSVTGCSIDVWSPQSEMDARILVVFTKTATSLLRNVVLALRDSAVTLSGGWENYVGFVNSANVAGTVWVLLERSSVWALPTSVALGEKATTASDVPSPVDVWATDLLYNGWSDYATLIPNVVGDRTLWFQRLNLGIRRSGYYSDSVVKDVVASSYPDIRKRLGLIEPVDARQCDGGCPPVHRCRSVGSALGRSRRQHRRRRGVDER